MLASFATNLVCDNPPPMTDFDVAKMGGTWYEQQHTKSVNEKAMSCSTAQYYNPVQDPTVPDMTDYTIYNSFQTEFAGHWTPRTGINAAGKCGADGYCYISYFSKPVPKPNLTIVDTDYTTYSIEWSCDVDQGVNMLWLNSRDAAPSDEVFNAMYAKAQELLPTYDFTTLDSRIYQGDKCTFGPVPTGESVADHLAAFAQ